MQLQINSNESEARTALDRALAAIQVAGYNLSSGEDDPAVTIATIGLLERAQCHLAISVSNLRESVALQQHQAIDQLFGDPLPDEAEPESA